MTSNIQAIRQNDEAEIARARELEPGHYRVEIPGYASAGDAIRARFHAELRAGLGDAAAAEVFEKLETRLENLFAGFGVSVQTLDIAPGATGDAADCEVTRTVTFWNSLEGTGRVATRRETHFPAWEDPSGERWGALLAVASGIGS